MANKSSAQGVCGPGAEVVHRGSLHSQACSAGSWWVRAWGCLRVLRVAHVSLLTRRDDTESFSVLGPTWPPSQALCPYTLAPGHLPGVEEGCPFIHSAANSAKVGSAHVGLVTQRKRQMDAESCRKMTVSFSYEQRLWLHSQCY